MTGVLNDDVRLSERTLNALLENLFAIPRDWILVGEDCQPGAFKRPKGVPGMLAGFGGGIHPQR